MCDRGKRPSPVHRLARHELIWSRMTINIKLRRVRHKETKFCSQTVYSLSSFVLELHETLEMPASLEIKSLVLPSSRYMAVKFNVQLACFLCVPTWLVAMFHFKFQTCSHVHSAFYKRSMFKSTQINSNLFSQQKNRII